jgi:hypothetical protein
MNTDLNRKQNKKRFYCLFAYQTFLFFSSQFHQNYICLPDN